MDESSNRNSVTTGDQSANDSGQMRETELKAFIMKEAPPPRNLSNTNPSSLSSHNLTERELSSSPIVDEYGFVNKFSCSRENYFAFKDRYQKQKEVMERNWKRLVKLIPRKESTTPPPLLNRSTSSPNSFEYKFEPFGLATKKALRQGIPGHLRPMAWFYYSGGEALRVRHPSPTAFYESLLLQPKPSAFFLLTDRMKMDFRDILPTNEILRKDYFSAANTMINEVPDVGRVRIIPDRVDSPNDSRPRRMTIFDRENPSGEDATLNVKVSQGKPFMSRLYNVLVAFFLFRSRVEYCRAICSIAAILLLVIQDEEKTFWTLSALFSNYSNEAEITFESPNEESIQFHDFREESIVADSTPVTVPSPTVSSTSSKSSTQSGDFKYFPEDMFRDTSTCSFAALDGFKAVLESKKPVLVSNLKSLDIPISLLTTTWFQSLFVDVLPTESSMRVLDAFIGEGYKVLYRVALALFYINESELLQKMKSSRSTSKSIFGSLLSRPSSPSSPSSGSSPSTTSSSLNTSQTVLNLIKFMPKKQVDADVLMDFAFNRIGSLPMSTIYAECKRAAEVERPLQSIRRFSQTPETKLSMDTIRRVSTTSSRH